MSLAEQVKREVQALPNPGERLVGLWDGVRSLETTLTESIGGASRAACRAQSSHQRALDRIGAARAKHRQAAETIEHGGWSSETRGASCRR